MEAPAKKMRKPAAKKTTGAKADAEKVDSAAEVSFMITDSSELQFNTSS